MTMKKNIMVIFASMFFSGLCIAQPKGSNEWHGNWEFGVPVGNNFVTSFSALGFSIGYSRFIQENTAVGIESGWNNYYEYAPRKTYEFESGAATTDLYKYIYTVPIVLNLTHYYKLNDVLSPFIRIGLGAQYSEQNLYYNVYETKNTNWGFVAIPEIGAIIHFNKFSPWGLNLAVRYKFSSNKATDLNINSIQTLNFAVGFAYTFR